MATPTGTPQTNVDPAQDNGTPAPGLINTAAPTGAMNAPTTAPAPGAAVTGYNPAQAQASTAGSTAYNPSAFNVAPNQTVASQINDIIASGSPLMEQAETNAKNMMNQRGLINSSQAITAGQSALYAAAQPIAAQDAQTYAQAATNTTAAQNQAAATNAAAANTASLQNSQLETQTGQYNAGQTNAALATEAGASNTLQQTQQQIAGQQQIAQIQANTSLSVEQQQVQSQQIIAQMNNENALAVQASSNASSLANIQANGVINEAVTNLTNQNKTLLQTSASASQVYTQALANMSAIITDKDLSEAQKTTALNDSVQQLNDALSAFTQMAGIPDVQSLVDFSSATGVTSPGKGTTNGPAGVPGLSTLANAA